MIILLFLWYWWVHAFQEGVHTLERRFHAFEKGLTFLKGTLAKTQNYIGGGVHAFEKRFHIFEKKGSHLVKHNFHIIGRSHFS